MESDFTQAVRLLQAGQLVAFPTETVYGLGADAANPEAVARIFAAKGRPADHPLIVHLPGAGRLEEWAQDVPSVAWELAEAFWPGPLTLILKRAPAVPYAVTGGQETVGVRVPAHPVALGLLRAFAQAGGGKGGLCGVAAPSANRFGRISPTDAAHVLEELGDAVALILDGGACDVGIESTILDLSRGDETMRILRPGHITPEQIAEVVGVIPEVPVVRKEADVPRVSGSLDGHYAPRTPMRMVASAELSGVLDQLKKSGKRFALLSFSQSSAHLPTELQRRLPEDPEGYAKGFYAALRELDQAGGEVIVVERIPSGSGWMAIADRLRRAVYGSGSGAELP